MSDSTVLDLVLDHLAHRNARPPGHHLSDRLPVYAHLHERALALHLGQLGVEAGQVRLQLLHLLRGQLLRRLVIRCLLAAGSGVCLKRVADAAQLTDQALLLLPARFQLGAAGLGCGLSLANSCSRSR